MQQATIHFLLRTKNFRVAGDRTAVGGSKKAAVTQSQTGSQESLQETGTTEKQSSEKRKQAEATKPVAATKKVTKKMVF